MDPSDSRLVRPLMVALLIAAILTAPVAQPVFAGPKPCGDPGDPAYGSHACKVERLRERPFVVIATVDSGINPYHVDFRIPSDDDRRGVHPSEYIEGFPASSPALNLSPDAATPAQGRARDAAEWAKVQPGMPVWLPGTNLLGAVPPGTTGDFFDDTNGHGTGVASVAGGQIYGTATKDVIVVAMKGSGAAWRWAANQPWIDLISISWTVYFGASDQSAEASREAAASGKISCVASGNASVPLTTFESQGPSSSMHVGAVDPESRTRKDYSGFPVDVLALTDFQAAAHNSVDGERTFGGTSAAAPHLCAMLARTISTARQRVGDFQEGPHEGGLVVGPAGAGALSDGVVNRLEIEDAVQATAKPISDDPGHFLTHGYGLVEDPTLDQAVRVLFGEAPRPARPDEDAWQSASDRGRDAVWNNVPDCPPPLC